MRVLHAAAEVYPWVKTGGLADVVGALPQALAEAGADVRLLLPGYPAVLGALRGAQTVAELGALFGAARVRLCRGVLEGSGVTAYVVDAPLMYRRSGNPYLGPDGREWSDNLQRFALLGWIGAHLASGELDPDWQPVVLHAHDWHAATAVPIWRRSPLPPRAACTPCTTWPTRACSMRRISRCSGCRPASWAAAAWSSTGSCRA